MAATAAGFFAVTYAIGVHTVSGQSAEEAILVASRFTHDQPILNLVTVPNLLIACAIVAALGLTRRRLSAAIVGVAIIGVSSVLAQVLKHGLLDRPALVSIGDNTFPSGHMTTFAAVAFAMLLVVPARMRTGVAVAGVLVLSVVGTLLLRLGWHRPSDVLGAILLVTCVSALAQLGVTREQSASTRPFGERMLAVLSVVAGTLAVISFVIHRESLWLDGLASPMLTAQLAMITAALMSAAVALWLLRHRPERRT